MELTQCINYLLTTSQHTVFQYLSGKLAEYDLTPSQYGVLSCLCQREFATPKQISEILCLETSTISGVLDRMQKKGLIDRVINKEDRREVRVIPTEKGKALQNVKLLRAQNIKHHCGNQHCAAEHQARHIYLTDSGHFMFFFQNPHPLNFHFPFRLYHILHKRQTFLPPLLRRKAQRRILEDRF